MRFQGSGGRRGLGSTGLRLRLRLRLGRLGLRQQVGEFGRCCARIVEQGQLIQVRQAEVVKSLVGAMAKPKLLREIEPFLT